MSRANSLLMNRAAELNLTPPAGGITHVWREYKHGTHHPPGKKLGWFIRLDGNETYLAPDFDHAMIALKDMVIPESKERKAG